MKKVFSFTDTYLQECRKLSADEIVQYLSDYRSVQIQELLSERTIALRVRSDLLNAFQVKAKLSGKKYQTLIKELMKEWLESSPNPQTIETMTLIWTAVIFISFFGASSWAQKPKPSVSKPVKVKVIGSQKKSRLRSLKPKPAPAKEILPPPPIKVQAPLTPYRWAGSVSYALRTDLADQISPRLYTHSLSGMGSVTHTPSRWSGFLPSAPFINPSASAILKCK